MRTSVEMVGNWTSQMQTTLSDALHASMDVGGRSVAEACKHALILMAQSAKKMARKAPLKRPVATELDSRREYVEILRQNKPTARVYRWQFNQNAGEARLEGTWTQAQRIKNRGLAGRSWMWGLAGLKGAGAAQNEMRGVAILRHILSEKVGGFILTNRLAYVEKAMPAGWRQMAEQSAIGRIMHTLRAKVRRMHERAIGEINSGRRSGANASGGMAKYIREAA